MRQFIYIVVFVLMAYLAKTAVPQPFSWPCALLLALAGVCFAFVPIEDRGLDEWLVNFLKAINSPTEMVWHKEAKLPQAFSYNQKLSVVQKELITLAPTTSRRKLEEYLEHESQKEYDPLDLPVDDYIQKIKTAFSSLPPSQPSLATATSVSLSPVKPVTDTSVTSIPRPHKPQETKEDTSLVKQKETPEEDKISKIIKARITNASVKLSDKGFINSDDVLRPVESHAGRRFVNLTPTQGQIILPIRGEKVISLERDSGSEQQDYEKKKEKIQQMLNATPENLSDAVKPSPSYREIPPMTDKPNMVSGVLKGKTGERLENVILLIKNDRGETVKALKTNKLGNFMTSSPIPNGSYQLEIDKTSSPSLSFDIIHFSTNGGLLPSFEILGH